MGVIHTIVGALRGARKGAVDSNPMHDALTALLIQSGGLRGLMNRFSGTGHGDVFASWVGPGENHPISSEEIQQVLGPDQVRAMAAKLGIDPQQASGFLAEHLPEIVDRLTPTGHIEPGTDVSKELTAIMPAVLPNFTGARPCSYHET